MREIKFRQYVNGKFHYWGFGVIDDGKGFTSPMNLHDPSDEYTGLLDKNGVEIYEGDKVRWGYMKNYYIVEYNPDNVCFQATNGTATGRFDRSDVEVIGNIYENPDLLSKEDTPPKHVHDNFCLKYGKCSE